MKTTKYYPDNENIAEAITRSIESDSGEKIFTLRVIENDPAADHLEAIIVFENKNILHAKITPRKIRGQLACRIQGNYL
jgi:hypothetical protein